MRSILVGAVGLSLSLGGLIHAQEPAASFGRPIPAASLGRPTALRAGDGQQPFQTAGYHAERAAPVMPVDTAPMLAPVDDQRPMPMPFPGDGSAGSTAVPPPGTNRAATGNPYYGPMPGPNYGPT